MFDKAYDEYLKKCKKLGIEPSSKTELFGRSIEEEKAKERVSIEDLSRERRAAKRTPAKSDIDALLESPKRMPRAEAAKLYRAKLFNHWVHDYAYDERVNLERKKEIVSVFMLGHPENYKKYEELK